MRVLIAGSRDWAHPRIIEAFLTGLYQECTAGHMVTEMSTFTVIDGEAPGADTAASEWAKNSPMHSHNERADDPHFEHLPFPADWAKYKNAAGPIRNQTMLEASPDLVVAFINKSLADSTGTKDMVERAAKAGVPTYVVQRVN